MSFFTNTKQTVSNNKDNKRYFSSASGTVKEAMEPVDLSDPIENKKEIEKLDKRFRTLSKQTKITKKNVLAYLEDVIKVINERDDY
tara:strand:+ start:1453 stop:1710 length:258 start_codon:yes stop_codon:yes gene_type:complete